VTTGTRNMDADAPAAPDRPFAPAAPTSEPAPREWAHQLDTLRTAVGEVDALAAVTAWWYGHEDEQDHVERALYLLGVIARLARAAVAAVDRFHVAVADAQPAPAGERWNYDKGTASGG
jgi:hypothetical protein